jgi:uncharacterized membrane protein
MKVYLANLQLINQNIQNRPNQFLFLFSNFIIGTIDTSNESLVIFNDSRHFVLLHLSFCFFFYTHLTLITLCPWEVMSDPM